MPRGRKPTSGVRPSVMTGPSPKKKKSTKKKAAKKK